MTKWSAVIPFNPVATPRPNWTVKDTKSGKKVITYYKSEYKDYLESIKKQLIDDNLYDRNFNTVVNSEYGVIANIIFYIGVPDSVKRITKITHTYKPDIDNLIKAIFDGIFNGLRVKDSRIVGVKALKIKTLEHPRTEISLMGLEDLQNEINAEPISREVDKVLTKVQEENVFNWTAVFPFAPMATPRPYITFRKVGVDINGKNKYKKHTYNSPKYEQYLHTMDEFLRDAGLYNEDLSKVVNSEYGVIAKVNFYCKVPKNQRVIRKIMKTTAPDIDNLLKAVLDGIFNNLVEDDSRVVGVQALKLNEIESPRTEITLSGLTSLVV